MKASRKLAWITTAVILVGMSVSTVSLITHYRSDPSNFCDISQDFNCDEVNRGPYATFATTGPIVFPSDPSQPPEPLLERMGDWFAAHLMQPLNDVALRMGIRVPVAGIGLAGYIVLLVLTWIGRSNRLVAAVQLALALLALVFSLYLTYLEKYVIAYWCILCLTSLAMITLVTVLAAVRLIRKASAAPQAAATPA